MNTKSTMEGPYQKKIEALEWSNQSSDLNPVQHLWGDLKRDVPRRCLFDRVRMFLKDHSACFFFIIIYYHKSFNFNDFIEHF